MVAAQMLGTLTFSRHLAVEGETDGVQNRRLSRAGSAADQKLARAVQLVEVNLNGAAERTERLDRQMVEQHQAPTAASASTSSQQAASASLTSSDSESVAREPRECS